MKKTYMVSYKVWHKGKEVGNGSCTVKCRPFQLFDSAKEFAKTKMNNNRIGIYITGVWVL